MEQPVINFAECQEMSGSGSGTSPIDRLKQPPDNYTVRFVGSPTKDQTLGWQRVNSAYTMKRKLSAASRQYVTALKKDMSKVCGRARGPGVQDVASGLRELCGGYNADASHRKTCGASLFSRNQKCDDQEPRDFFVEVMATMEKTLSAAMETRVQLNQLNQTLRRRTRELAGANRQLKRGIVRRQVPEEALQKGGQH